MNTKISNTNITVGETIERYKALRRDVAGNTLRELYQAAHLWIRNGSHIKLDTYFQLLLSTEIILDNTAENLHIFGGKDIVVFLETLDGAFFGCCERIYRNNGRVRIVAQVFNEEEEENVLKELKRLTDKLRATYSGIRLKALITTSDISDKIGYYAVFDGRALISEKPRESYSLYNPGNSIDALLIPRAPSLAEDHVEAIECYFQK